MMSLTFHFARAEGDIFVSVVKLKKEPMGVFTFGTVMNSPLDNDCNNLFFKHIIFCTCQISDKVDGN